MIEHETIKMQQDLIKAQKGLNKELRRLADTLDTVIQSQAAIYETLTEVKDELISDRS
jgi:uncharacterized membrane-anchored protein YhcB (DUF1043 family)